MNALASRLIAMQQADSFFPGGALAWSWGLETLVADGLLCSETNAEPARRRRGIRPDRSAEVLAFIEGQLRHRWASFDRAFLQAAWLAEGDLARLYELDAMLEALTLAAELREGSRRIGMSLLSVHTGLETPGARTYRQAVLGGRASGHLPIVQGMLWRALGMQPADGHLAAGYALCTGLLGAALRLGVLGHMESQQVLTRLQPALLELLAETPAPPEDACSFTPMAEIAVMRHETQDLRLFAN